MIRRIATAMGKALENVSLDDLRIRPTDGTLTILATWFPDDAKMAFAKIDPKKLGTELARSVPRHWDSLCSLSTFLDWCGSDIICEIISACDLKALAEQVRQFALSNRHEFRVLLHSLSAGGEMQKKAFAERIYDVVKNTCEPKDSESASILMAYHRLDPSAASRLGVELNLTYEIYGKGEDLEELEESRAHFRDKDTRESDYHIDEDDNKAPAIEE
jgi:hypothetical protein